MSGSEAQAGFYYQNIVAAQYALDLIEFGSRLRSLTLENPGRAKCIDDVIADSADGTAFVQVKWSQNDSSALTLHSLVTTEENSTSLFAKLARGYRKVVSEDGRQEIILLSTRRAGTNRQPGRGFDKSLAEFIEEFHQAYVDDESVKDVRQATRFDEYEPILRHLLAASGLRDFNELSGFLKCLRFRLSQPDRDTMAERVYARLARLGLEQGHYATLLDEVVRWSITGAEVQPDDVRRALGVLDRFVDRVSHYFPVDRKVWVPTPALFEMLDSSIGTLEDGFLLLEGEPGSGKSTALTMYLSARPDVLFGYYCFVPSDRTLGNERLGDDAFVRSVCIGLRNAFPDTQFPRPYAPHTVELLNEWLNTLSAAKRRVVFVVDGLDHVDRKTRQSLVARPLTAVLDGELPRNVLIVLSSRYPEVLPPRVIEHVRSNPKRHIRMPRFGRAQVREFFRLRAVGVADEFLDAAVDVSGGVPIYLEYLADRLGAMNRYEQERYLASVPALRDDRIDAYHRHLWEACKSDEKLIYILAILAVREEFTTLEILRELLQLVRVDATLQAVHEGIAEVRHVLRVSDAGSVAIRHSSLAEFVAERTEHLRDEIARAMADWYDQHPDSDEGWRHRFRHLFHAGEYAKVLAACDDEWLVRAWASHRPMPEIQRNLDIAWRAASVTRDVLAFVRIGLLKQRIALVGRNVNLSEVELAQFLLTLGRLDEALRRVWDGERRQCDSVGFAAFCLSHVASTGRVLPERVLHAGLGDDPGPSASLEATKTWYRARSLTGDPSGMLEEIGRTRWQTKTPHGHAKGRVDEEESRRLNLGIQLAVVRELAERHNLDSLGGVRDYEVLSQALRVAARAALGLSLARAGETADATSELQGLDLSCLPEADRQWFVLELAACGLDGLLVPNPAAPPQLPGNLLDSREQKLSERLFDLYDDLRVFFLRDDTGFPWFEAATTGLTEPVRTFASAIGRLARLWACWIRNTPTGDSPVALLKDITDDLDLRHHLFLTLDHGGDLAERLYRRSLHRFYEQAWSCATLVLSEVELEEFARWWARNSGGGRALCYPEATRTLATTVSGRLKDAGSTVSRELLQIAERSERADEETSAIAPGLVACASAWGRCGFPADAQRLWCELLDVACGVDWRKDYQFNEIRAALELAHKHDPHGTLNRVEEQLALAHQLVGTAQSKTVAVAVEGLIEFVSRVHPGLALDALVREEGLVYRERALHKVILALLHEGVVDRRLLLALVATMSPWKNYVDFDEHTKPAMFAVYSSALQRHDVGTARKAYDLWRHVLLVEKQMPAELGRWAAAWVQAGETPSDVLRDHADYPPQEEEAPSEPAFVTDSSEDERRNEELDELAGGDLGKLEARLDEVLRKEIRQDRRRELGRAQDDWVTALGQAAQREWSEEEKGGLEECFQAFTEATIEVPAEPGPLPREAMRTALKGFVAAVSDRLSCAITLEKFGGVFGVDEWLDGFIGLGTVPYILEQKIRERLPAWIAAAPFAKLAAWEDFCDRRCRGETRAAGLLALAERRATAAPERAVANLIEAWESTSDFFHEYGQLARRICSKLLVIDNDKGAELVFESFRQQYQRFPESIIYRLDILLEFAVNLPRFDAVQLYNIWAAHNRRLASGLSQKPMDLGWLKEPTHEAFQDACLKYLIGLFDYPVVDIRLLALAELFRLLVERQELIDAVLHAWSGLGDGQKEYVASLLFSIGMQNPPLAERWAPKLLLLGQREPHRNLRATIAEAIQAAADRGANLALGLVVDARALKTPPRVALAQTPPLHVGPAAGVPLPPYLEWSADVLADSAPPGELKTRTQTMLSRLCPRPERGLQEEAAVHRDYNINTNFDVIEIGGEYDRAVRAALNRAVQSLVDSHATDQYALELDEDLLRLRDPTDSLSLVRRVSRPAEISWIDCGLSDDEFTGFADIDRLKAGYGRRDGEWVTVFEYAEQRAGERLGSDPQRATKVRTTLFGMAGGEEPPTLNKVTAEARRRALTRLRNRYRFELARAVAPQAITRIVPVVVVTGRAFRGRPMPDLAAVVPELAEAFLLTPAPDDLLGYLMDGEKVVRSIEWQEAFDQGRRRHEPRSVGFLLQVKRDMLNRVAKTRDLEFWAHLSARRTTDRYKPECEMTWHEHSDDFLVKLG